MPNYEGSQECSSGDRCAGAIPRCGGVELPVSCQIQMAVQGHLKKLEVR